MDKYFPANANAYFLNHLIHTEDLMDEFIKPNSPDKLVEFDDQIVDSLSLKNQPFTIVGMGGSAGSFSAIQEFLSEIPRQRYCLRTGGTPGPKPAQHPGRVAATQHHHAGIARRRRDDGGA